MLHLLLMRSGAGSESLLIQDARLHVSWNCAALQRLAVELHCQLRMKRHQHRQHPQALGILAMIEVVI
jgi:hypothetical protein